MLLGNASQLSDGAAAVLLSRRSYARHHSLPMLGVLRDFTVVGVAPDIMGVAPAVAIPQLLRRTGLYYMFVIAVMYQCRHIALVSQRTAVTVETLTLTVCREVK